MHQSLQIFLRIAAFPSSFFILFALPIYAHADMPDNISGDIVVTIKPLYSLVAQLSDGVKKPVLLIKQMPSAHHYAMRPSERRLLANAHMIVWIGPQMESYLSKVILQQDAIIISAMQVSGLKLLTRRKKNGAHDHHHAIDADVNTDANVDTDYIDPHIWLSSHNAIAISKHIAQQLIIHDPENTSRYQKNLQRLSDKISQLAVKIKATLKNKPQAFITYHDAFQYFENENKLRYLDSINFDEEAGTSLKHLRQIKASIEKNNVQCLVYQPPEPDIIKTLSANSAIKAVALDPLGQRVSKNDEAWFEIMQNLATNFEHCLSR